MREEAPGLSVIPVRDDANEPLPRPARSPRPAHEVRAVASYGSPFHIRRALRNDRSRLIEMLARCTDNTRQRRFHKYVRSFPEPYLTEALEGRAEHVALIAETPGAIVALASCRATADDVAELAVLVEDSCQRQGIGACLLRMIIDHADRSGLRTLNATVLADQEWILRLLRRYGACEVLVSSGIIEITLRREPDRIHGPRSEVISYGKDASTLASGPARRRGPDGSAASGPAVPCERA
jgi:N-acetylglutamate synthase-like GNAT family acetyltransferase